VKSGECSTGSDVLSSTDRNTEAFHTAHMAGFTRRQSTVLHTLENTQEHNTVTQHFPTNNIHYNRQNCIHYCVTYSCIALLEHTYSWLQLYQLMHTEYFISPDWAIQSRCHFQPL